MEFEDILYEVRNGVAWITINRPEKMNAFRGQHLRRADPGAESRRLRQRASAPSCWPAPATGPSAPAATSRAHDGNYDGRGTIGLPIEELQSLIRDVPKPVIARVQGYRHRRRQRAVHHLRPHHRLREGHLRPGRPEDGLGRSGLRHRLPGARGRREEGARDLVPVPALHRRRRRWPWAWATSCVPHDQLDAEVAKWCEEIMEKSPTALAIAKRSFNADTENIRGIGGLGMQALKLYYDTEESRKASPPSARSASPTSASTRSKALAACRPLRLGTTARGTPARNSPTVILSTKSRPSHDPRPGNPEYPARLRLPLRAGAAGAGRGRGRRDRRRFPPTSSPRCASWACSACRSPRNTAASA